VALLPLAFGCADEPRSATEPTSDPASGAASAPTGEAVPAPPDASALAPGARARIEACLVAVRAAPDDPEAWIALATAYDAHALFDLAVPAWRGATARADERAEPWYHLARCLGELGRLEEALAALERALEREPGYAPAHARKGFWLLDLGRLDEAGRAFRRADEHAPEDDAGRLGLARVALERDRPEDALALLEEVVARHPRNGYAYQLLGTALRRTGDRERAREALARGVGSQPVWYDAWRAEVEAQSTHLLDRLERAREAVRDGRSAEVVDELEALAREHPAQIALLSTLVPAYVATDRVDDAIAVLERALELRPDHYRIHLNLGLLLPRRGRLAEALEQPARAVVANPVLCDAYLHLARLQAGAGREDEAAATLASAVERRAATPAVWVELGRLEGRRGRWEEACTAYAAAAELAPDAATPWLLLAAARAELGELGPARTALERAAPLAAGDPLVARIDAKLRSLEGADASQP